MAMMTTNNTFRSELNNQQLMVAAPSIFAKAPCADVSERYNFIPTIDVVNGLRDAGWFPVQAQQTKVQKVGNIDKALHMVRFRNPDLQLVGADMIYPEVIMTNSHDRSAAFKFLTGLFRMVCSNGLITSDADFGSVTVRHNSKAIDESIAAAFQMLENVPQVVQEIDRFKQIELNPVQTDIFARSALDFQYGVHGQQIEDKPTVIYGNPRKAYQAKRDGNENVAYIPIAPDAILIPKRREDSGKDLWTTYNVIQENLIKGGRHGRSESGRRSRTQGVTAINQDVKLNKALWSMASYMADHLS